MFENVELIQLREFPLKLKEGYQITKEVLSDTKIGVALRFQYQEAAGDVVAMHSVLTVLSASSGEDLIRTGCTIIFRYSGWMGISHEVDSVRNNKDIKDIAHYLMGLSGGVFFKTMQKFIDEETPIIPLMDEDGVISKMSVEKLD